MSSELLCLYLRSNIITLPYNTIFLAHKWRHKQNVTPSFLFYYFQKLKNVGSLLAKNFSSSFSQRAVMLLGIFSITIYFRGSPLFSPPKFSTFWWVDFARFFVCYSPHHVAPKPLQNLFLQFFPVWAIFWRRFTPLDRILNMICFMKYVLLQSTLYRC